jgi:sulfate transport system ATP-binding protein
VGEGRADGPGTAFIRPHDVEILELNPDLPQAKVRQVVVLGPVVRAELELPDGVVVEAELSRDAMERLGLRRGLDVSVFLRKARIFVGENI